MFLFILFKDIISFVEDVVDGSEKIRLLHKVTQKHQQKIYFLENNLSLTFIPLLAAQS